MLTWTGGWCARGTGSVCRLSEANEKLAQPARGRVVFLQNVGECSVLQRLGQMRAKCFSGSVVCVCRGARASVRTIVATGLGSPGDEPGVVSQP